MKRESLRAYGLHRHDIEEQEEIPSDLSQLELDQANRKFSMSQPVLDTFDTFDIPSPPPVATKPIRIIFYSPKPITVFWFMY
ncbi:hypothetical protein KUCAC02_011268 [Chaenocephalus aceratus]|uniref:Uncharacterized protein n=1 Tax=Chaenocephalus aceratus TaxID=36190 RepID=A0ACB9WWT8_CHAAC|nr:hypothetical protein KUCAC02_011268 [Chaenocephalus aceratus]